MGSLRMLCWDEEPARLRAALGDSGQSQGEPFPRAPGRRVTKGATAGSQRGVSPHPRLSQTLRPGTQGTPPCRCLKTQCPEERPLEMPASSRRGQTGDPLPSRPDLEQAGPPRSLGARPRPCPSQGSRPSPVGTPQAARPLGAGQGAWQGLVPWARPSEEGERGPGLRSPGRKAGSWGTPPPTLLGQRVTSQEGSIHCRIPPPRGRDAAARAQRGLPGRDSNLPPVKDILRPGGRFGRGPGLALPGSFLIF